MCECGTMYPKVLDTYSSRVKGLSAMLMECLEMFPKWSGIFSQTLTIFSADLGIYKFFIAFYSTTVFWA